MVATEKPTSWVAGHAHIGAAIVKSSRWPQAYQDKLLTVNMHGRRLNTEILQRHGAGYIGKHAPDLALWADPFFRGIDLRFGPDGQLYVIDWSDTGECHESTGVHRTSGRIYKISYTGAPDAQLASIENSVETIRNWDSTRLIALLSDSDEHVRVRAIRQLSDAWPIDTMLGPHPQAVTSVDPLVMQALVRAAKEDRSHLSIWRWPRCFSACQSINVSSSPRNSFRNPNWLAIEIIVMLWFGLIAAGKQNPESLIGIAKVNQLPLVQRYLPACSQVEPTPIRDHSTCCSHSLLHCPPTRNRMS